LREFIKKIANTNESNININKKINDCEVNRKTLKINGKRRKQKSIKYFQIRKQPKTINLFNQKDAENKINLLKNSSNFQKDYTLNNINFNQMNRNGINEFKKKTKINKHVDENDRNTLGFSHDFNKTNIKKNYNESSEIHSNTISEFTSKKEGQHYYFKTVFPKEDTKSNGLYDILIGDNIDINKKIDDNNVNKDQLSENIRKEDKKNNKSNFIINCYSDDINNKVSPIYDISTNDFKYIKSINHNEKYNFNSNAIYNPESKMIDSFIYDDKEKHNIDRKQVFSFPYKRETFINFLNRSHPKNISYNDKVHNDFNNQIEEILFDRKKLHFNLQTRLKLLFKNIKEELIIKNYELEKLKKLLIEKNIANEKNKKQILEYKNKIAKFKGLMEAKTASSDNCLNSTFQNNFSKLSNKIYDSNSKQNKNRDIVSSFNDRYRTKNSICYLDSTCSKNHKRYMSIARRNDILSK